MKRNYENREADRRYAALCADLTQLPLTFVYNGTRYNGVDPAFFTHKKTDTEPFPGGETKRFFFDFDRGIEMRLALTHYFTHGVTEWTVWFENASAGNSGVFEDLGICAVYEGGRPVLKGILGDHVNRYRPYSVDLTGGEAFFSSDSGRATHEFFPYFNLEFGEGGAMLALGWAGTWRARFSYENGKTLFRAASVNGLKTFLKPGETIRSALFVSAPYRVRDERYAANFWRSWFIRHNLPRADAAGAPLTPFSTCCLMSDTGLPNSDGSISERYTTWRPSLEKMLAENVKVDFRWFDAGWYIAPDKSSAQPYVRGHDWWDTVGTWELDPVKWPGKTFLESTEFARAYGMKTLVWFEPERVTDPENLALNFGYDPAWAIRMPGSPVISNNIGNPACAAWTTGRITKMLRENRVELYREDNNCDAAALWAQLDAEEGENRRGITESRFIIAHYQMWDEIIACTSSYGGCAFVDSCASGGGRNDLESMRRGVPILRSDSDRTSSALRLSMTSSFNKWIPFCGANTKEKESELAPKGISDKYVWRASYLPILNVDAQFVYADEGDFDILRFGLKEWKRVSPYLLCEFYVLTDPHGGEDRSGFTAFCYFDPESESGVLLAFRQEECAESALHISLPFAQEGESYTLTDEDSGEETSVGKDSSLFFEAPRSSKLLWIRKGEDRK